MRQLFLKGMANPPISKNMPPKAGAIAWARSIMGRIKSPIYKFKTKQDLLLTPTGKEVTKIEPMKPISSRTGTTRTPRRLSTT
jgi:hypothetical protein